MPISGRSFQTFALRTSTYAPALPLGYFLFPPPSIPFSLSPPASPPSISVPSLPTALPRLVVPLCYPLLPAFADLYSPCVDTRGATGTRVLSNDTDPNLARSKVQGVLDGYGKCTLDVSWTDFVWNDPVFFPKLIVKNSEDMIEWKFSHEIKIILNFRRMIFWILSLYMSQKKIFMSWLLEWQLHLINRLIFFTVPAEMDKKANKLENVGARYEDVARKLITLENMVTIRNGYPRNGCSHRLPASCLHCARSIPENSEYYVTYSGSFIHENPNPTVIIFNRGPLDFATSAFFPCVPTTRGGSFTFEEERNSSSITSSKEKTETCSSLQRSLVNFNPLERITFSHTYSYISQYLARSKRKSRGGWKKWQETLKEMRNFIDRATKM